MGFVRKTPAGGHRACWRDPTGRQKSKTFATKREARAGPRRGARRGEPWDLH